MERIVIVGYKPLAGKELALKELIKSHWQTLDAEGLVSARKPIIAQSSDGTIIEVFGWKSKEAMQMAHSNPIVQKMWEAYASVCEYVPIGQLDEAKSLFSEFGPIN